MKILVLLMGVISLGGINSNVVNVESSKVADDFVPNHEEALKWLIRFNYMVSNLGNNCYNRSYIVMRCGTVTIVILAIVHL